MLAAERFAAQRLIGEPCSTPFEAVRALLAVQGQDPRGFRLAVRARCVPTLVAADVEACLADRELLVSTFCRGTLHLICAEDYGLLQQLTTPQLHTAVRTRLSADGVSAELADRAVAAIERALRDGPLTRAELVPVLERAGVQNHGQTLIHLVFLAAISGVLVRGPMVGKQHAFVHAREWLGPLWTWAGGTGDRLGALTELVRRYLVGHGPASERDIARWAGLRLGDTRAALKALGGSLAERSDGLIALRSTAGGANQAEAPAPRLLGAFDPVLLGWADRSFITGEHEPSVIAGGMFRPFAMVDGCAVATWGVRGGRVVLDEPWRPVAADALAALARDAEDLARYLAL